MMRYILVGIFALMAVAVGLMTFQWYRGAQTAAAFGAPFELVDHNGDPITEAAFKGSPTAVFFGFTHCPDVCPTTLFEMEGWLDTLGTEGDELEAYFVSVDPERDTPEVMKGYIGNFSDRITGITGDPEAVMEMVKAFRIFARKVELEGGDYTMDHTASVMLLDSQGDFFGTISYEENAETAVTKLRRLIREG
ncbi:SCO family protein [Chelativorans sp. M5D2P16]|uniref:SCO family protein n=1 Tax=Chelativorans sp. M5D2P16 TaxID=3095678 RepID=UPI002ACA7927|nr:SCO family protein [Chelativorans sp. M5D2P16]MDZ5698180.1 SCO family protein [Chelativorans sp. M5D2P16]